MANFVPTSHQFLSRWRQWKIEKAKLAQNHASQQATSLPPSSSNYEQLQVWELSTALLPILHHSSSRFQPMTAMFVHRWQERSKVVSTCLQRQTSIISNQITLFSWEATMHLDDDKEPQALFRVTFIVSVMLSAQHIQYRNVMRYVCSRGVIWIS